MRTLLAKKKSSFSSENKLLINKKLTSYSQEINSLPAGS